MKDHHDKPAAIAIDKGVPIPQHAGSRVRKYPFPDMEVGDSFFMPTSSTRLSQAGNNWGKQNGGARFAARAVTEGGVKGARVWRIA